MNDLIDRQSAIDALNIPDYENGEAYMQYEEDVNVIHNLPSAEPEIIRCRDCKYWDTTWESAWAKDYHYCPLIDGTSKGDWYCADAERRTNGRD